MDIAAPPSRSGSRPVIPEQTAFAQVPTLPRACLLIHGAEQDGAAKSAARARIVADTGALSNTASSASRRRRC